jgi:UDP-GlcNAc:undecaprenyl-phosphate GlcNAc-1-phosphate transferase
MAGAILGFLRHNFPPARVYLGDGGAYLLGFQIALFSLLNSRKGNVAAALLAPTFVLVLPIIDASLTLVRRGLQGLPLLRPDRRHIHHLLLQSGLSSRQVLWLAYGLTLLFLPLGLLTLYLEGKSLPALLGVGLAILVLCARRFPFSREWIALHRVVRRTVETRAQIRYAMLLTRWLSLEGKRQRSQDDLWEDFIFAARKLGFSSVKLCLPGRERSWVGQCAAAREQSAVYRLRDARCGLLHLKAPRQEGWELTGKRSAVADERIFEVFGELLAESWIRATEHWQTEKSSLRLEAAVQQRLPGKRLA